MGTPDLPLEENMLLLKYAEEEELGLLQRFFSIQLSLRPAPHICALSWLDVLKHSYKGVFLGTVLRMYCLKFLKVVSIVELHKCVTITT